MEVLRKAEGRGFYEVLGYWDGRLRERPHIIVLEWATVRLYLQKFLQHCVLRRPTSRHGVNGRHHRYAHRQRVGTQVADRHGRTTLPLAVMGPAWLTVGNALSPVGAQHLCGPPVEAQEGHGLPAEDQGYS
jgi:hypothetical protein